MDILVPNKITGYENEIKEINDALKHTKSVSLYEIYSVFLKHFNGFSNRQIAEIENIDEHTVVKYSRQTSRNKFESIFLYFFI